MPASRQQTASGQSVWQPKLLLEHKRWHSVCAVAATAKQQRWKPPRPPQRLERGPCWQSRRRAPAVETGTEGRVITYICLFLGTKLPCSISRSRTWADQDSSAGLPSLVGFDRSSACLHMQVKLPRSTRRRDESPLVV